MSGHSGDHNTQVDSLMTMKTFTVGIGVKGVDPDGPGSDPITAERVDKDDVIIWKDDVKICKDDVIIRHKADKKQNGLLKETCGYSSDLNCRETEKLVIKNGYFQTAAGKTESGEVSEKCSKDVNGSVDIKYSLEERTENEGKGDNKERKTEKTPECAESAPAAKDESKKSTNSENETTEKEDVLKTVNCSCTESGERFTGGKDHVKQDTSEGEAEAEKDEQDKSVESRIIEKEEKTTECGLGEHRPSVGEDKVTGTSSKEHGGSYQSTLDLEDVYLFLTGHMTCSRKVCAKLYAQGAITTRDDDDVMAQGNYTDEARCLLAAVKRHNCSDEFVEALKQCQRLLAAYVIRKKQNPAPYMSAASVPVAKGPCLPEKHKAVLQAEYEDLRECACVTDVITDLYTSLVLSRHQLEHIKKIALDYEKMSFIIKSVIMRGTMQDFDTFFNILKNHDPAMAAKLEQRLENAEEDAVLQKVMLSNARKRGFEEETTHAKIKRTKTGSVILFLDVTSFAEFTRIQRDVDSGDMHERVTKWLGKIDQSREGKVLLHLRLDIKLKNMASAGLLTSPIRYEYCEKEQAWYWTTDEYNWCHVSRVQWPFGDDKGKVPSYTDLQILKSLVLKNTPETHSDACIICIMRDLECDVGEATIEYFEEIAIVVNIFKDVRLERKVFAETKNDETKLAETFEMLNLNVKDIALKMTRGSVWSDASIDPETTKRKVGKRTNKPVEITEISDLTRTATTKRQVEETKDYHAEDGNCFEKPPPQKILLQECFELSKQDSTNVPLKRSREDTPHYVKDKDKSADICRPNSSLNPRS